MKTQKQIEARLKLVEQEYATLTMAINKERMYKEIQVLKWVLE